MHRQRDAVQKRLTALLRVAHVFHVQNKKQEFFYIFFCLES